MELWKDLEKSRYFAMDPQSGINKVCDRFGQPPKSFTPYSSGFSKTLTHRIGTPDNNYRVQPTKFDGYFQCPRPAGKVKFTEKIRLEYNVNTLPRPVDSLFFSSNFDKNSNRPSFKTPPPTKKIKIPNGTCTLDELKKQMLPPVSPEIKTARQLIENLQYNRINDRSLRIKEKKAERRKLKGYFMADIPSSTELFQKEKKMLVLTNPECIFRQKKFEEMDRKYLEKRREQKVLKNKLTVIQKK